MEREGILGKKQPLVSSLLLRFYSKFDKLTVFLYFVTLCSYLSKNISSVCLDLLYKE